jgi:hypothetical protein
MEFTLTFIKSKKCFYFEVFKFCLTCMNVLAIFKLILIFPSCLFPYLASFLALLIFNLFTSACDICTSLLILLFLEYPSYFF